MYNLFEDENLPRYPLLKLGQIDYLRRSYQREVLRVIDYYGSRISVIKNDHLLNRLIVSGCPPLGYELPRFVSASKLRAPIIADNFQITSTSNYGKVFDGVFYGGAMEIILLDDSDFDADEAYRNWREVEAVKVHHHPFTDYKLIPPFGQQYTTKDGLLTVLSINITKLMVQYKGFMDFRRNLVVVDGEKMNLGSTHFIKMHVLPNILRSHVEFIFYNRFKDLFYTLPNYDAIGKLPFAVLDYSKLADSIASEYLEKYKDKGVPYAQILQNIPGVFNDNIHQSLFMPDAAKTKQVWWALFLTRLEDQFFMLHLGGDQGISANRKYYSKFLVDCKWFSKDNTFRSVLANSIYSGYYYDMKDIMKGKI